MNSNNNNVIEITSVLVDDRHELSLEEICQCCDVDRQVIVELVEQGVVEPKTTQAQSWRFGAVVVPKIARALRLQRDFELNSAGVALALDLLEEIETLQRQLKRRESGGENKL